MKKFEYITHGTCSRQIDIEYDPESHTIGSVRFCGGCNGNLQGISKLVKGRDISEVIQSLEGIQCGNKDTSCPDQLARALKSLQ